MLFFKGSFTKSFLSFFGFVQLELRIQPAVSFLIWGHSFCAFKVLTHTFLYSWLIKSSRLRNIAFTLFPAPPPQRKNCIFNIIRVSIVGDSQWQAAQGSLMSWLVPMSPGPPEEVIVGSGFWVSTVFFDSLCSTLLLSESHSFPTLSLRFALIPLAPHPPHLPFLVSPKQGDTVVMEWTYSQCSYSLGGRMGG